MRPITAATLVGLAAFAGMPDAGAANSSTGVYVGAGVGSATANTTVHTPGWQAQVDNTTTGWNVFAGMRPGKILGVELNYIDFGNSRVNNVQDGSGNVIYQASAKNTAVTGYFVGYVPSLPTGWDIFGKVGIALLDTKTDSNGNYPNIAICNATSCPIVGMASTSTSHRTNDFAYGIGAQYRFGSVGVRAEYQKITASEAKPDLISVGVTWNF